MSKGPTLESSASARISAEVGGATVDLLKVAVAWMAWMAGWLAAKSGQTKQAVRTRTGSVCHLSSAYIADNYLPTHPPPTHR